MTGGSDSFKFNFEDSEIPVQRVGVVLRALDNLAADIQVDQIETLGSINRASIEMMTEAEIAQYLRSFLVKLQNNSMSLTDIHSHVMFQSVLVKAREIENSKS